MGGPGPGLADPARSAGGTRRYSRRDIDRLAEVARLRGRLGDSAPPAPRDQSRRARQPAAGG